MSETSKKRKNVMSRGFLTLMIAYTLACTGYQFLATMITSYGTEVLCFSKVTIASITGSIAIAGLCMRPISAVVVDKFNKRNFYAFTIVGVALSVFLFSVFTSYTGLYAAQIVRGVFWALMSTSGLVMVSEMVDRDDLGVAMGIYALGQVIAKSIGATIALSLANRFSFVIAFRIGSCVCVLGALLILTIPYEKSTANKDASVIETIKNIRFRNIFAVETAPIAVLNFMYQMLQTSLGSYVIAYARAELNLANIGVFATISNTIMWVTRPLFGKISDKYGVKWCFIPSSIGFVVTCLILATTNGMTGIILAACVYGAVTGGCMPMTKAVAIKTVEPERRGVATSTNSIGADVGLLSSNMVIAGVATAFSTYRASYYFMAGVAIVSLIFTVIYFTIYNKKHPGNVLGW